MKLSKIGTFLALALAWIIAGCTTPSLHGFHKSLDLEHESELEGIWIDEDGAEYQVESGKGKTYDVLVSRTEDGETISLHLNVAMARIDGRRVIDVSLAKDELKKIEQQYGTLLLPAHQFFRIEPNGEGLKVYWLEEKWVETWPEVIEYEDHPLMTSSSAKLKHLVEAAARDDKAWDNSFELRRK